MLLLVLIGHSIQYALHAVVSFALHAVVSFQFCRLHIKMRLYGLQF